MSWWSDPNSPEDVLYSRALRLLLETLDAHGQTALTANEAVMQVGPQEVISGYSAVGKFAHSEGLFRTDMLNGGPANDRLLATARGQAIAEKFRQAHTRSTRRRTARVRLLAWLDNHAGPGAAAALVDSPSSWSYGSHFNLGDVSAAGQDLHDRGLLIGHFAYGGDLYQAQLTAEGRTCLDQFGGDVDVMLRTGPTIQVDHLHNDGNLTMGGRGVQQTTSPAPQPAGNPIGDLTVVLQRVGEYLAVPEETRLYATATADLLLAQHMAPDGDVRLGLAQAGRVLDQAARSIQGDQLTAAALTALARAASAAAS